MGVLMSSEEPLISVVVPVYNVESYLERCVRSICEQTYTNLQIILVDDGATDSSGAICDSCAKGDSRITVIHKPNGGLSDARNKGMSYAQGEFVTFVDSDDYIGINHVANLHKAYKTNPNCPLAITGTTRFSKPIPSTVMGDIAGLTCKKLSKNEALSIALAGKQSSLFAEHACGKLYKKELFPLLVFPLNRLYEDRFLCYRIICEANGATYEDANDYFYYYDREDSLRHKPSIKQLDNLEATREMLPYLKTNAPKIYPQVRARFSGELIGSFGIAHKLNNEEAQSALFDEIKANRHSVITGNYAAISTKIAFLLSFLGMRGFSFLLEKLARLS